MNAMLRFLEEWVGERRLSLKASGVQVSLDFSLQDRDNASAWVDLDTPCRLVRLIVWESGEVTLSVGDVASGEILADEQLQVSATFGLEQVLGEAVAWAVGNG
ncbi:hypothetical protein KEM60_01151 [Austwickia sp. TVS 96-490-7B]|nr:hypothetical protein [Austwickia sp. TVS 96-490-7B]